MITGCNTNIRHRGMLFHVQTEDSGRANPHIISHVYYGGTIVGSRKQDYADAIELPDLDREVRSRIEDQHREMLKALRRGEFDGAIDERLGGRQTAATEPDAAAGATDPDAAGATGSTTAAGSATAPPTEPDSWSERPVPARAPGGGPASPAFGDHADAQKPLDEVILEYLVEKARERSADRRPSRPSRNKE